MLMKSPMATTTFWICWAKFTGRGEDQSLALLDIGVDLLKDGDGEGGGLSGSGLGLGDNIVAL